LVRITIAPIFFLRCPIFLYHIFSDSSCSTQHWIWEQECVSTTDHANHLCQPSLHCTPEVLSDPGVPGVQSMGPVLCHSLRPRPFADLTDVTLVDEDTKLILLWHLRIDF
jgi:hypothetical protein